MALITLHYYIKRKSQDNITFIEFDMSLQFYSSDVIAHCSFRKHHSENHWY
jgi:hypothetical protein